MKESGSPDDLRTFDSLPQLLTGVLWYHITHFAPLPCCVPRTTSLILSLISTLSNMKVITLVCIFYVVAHSNLKVTTYISPIFRARTSGSPNPDYWGYDGSLSPSTREREGGTPCPPPFSPNYKIHKTLSNLKVKTHLHLTC